MGKEEALMPWFKVLICIFLERTEENLNFSVLVVTNEIRTRYPQQKSEILAFV